MKIYLLFIFFQGLSLALLSYVERDNGKEIYVRDVIYKKNSMRSLFDFQKNPYYFFDQVKPKNMNEIKPIKMGFKSFYFSYHPDHAKHILQDYRKNYQKSRLVLKKIKALSGPQGLIQLSDQDALSVRQSAGRLMALDRLQALSEYVKKMVEAQFDLFDEIAEKQETVDLKPFLTELVLRTAGVFIFNEDIHSNAAGLDEAFVNLNRMAGEGLRSANPFLNLFKKRKDLKKIHKELDRVISKKLVRHEISLLHELHSKNLPYPFIRDQVKAFMFAGYDTTASSLIFATDLVSRDLNIQNEIYAERDLSFHSAKLAQAAYKESLRLYPSAYFLPRQAVKDDFIGGQRIIAGSQVFISVRHIHRNQEIYPNPETFQPRRFLEKIPHSHAFIPFGGGPRVCIGSNLAIMEATTLMQTLCGRYKLVPVNNKPPEIEGLITAHTKSPLLLKLERRA